MRNVIAVFLVAATLGLAACSAKEDDENKDSSEEEAETAAVLEGTVEMQVFDKTLRVTPKIPELTCNQFFIEFVTTKTVGCTAVTAKNEYSGDEDLFIWTIKSPDQTIDFTAKEKNEDSLTFSDDIEYNCWTFKSMKTWPEGATEEFDYDLATVTVVTRQDKLASPDEVDPEQTYLVAFTDGENCQAAR